MKLTLDKLNAELLGLKEGQEIEIVIEDKEEKIEEAEVNIDKIIKDMQGDFGGSNEKQMAGLQLLKGLATSDDPKANQFMQELNKATTAISKKMLTKNESLSEDQETLEEADSSSMFNSAMGAYIGDLIKAGYQKDEIGKSIKKILKSYLHTWTRKKFITNQDAQAILHGLA